MDGSRFDTWTKRMASSRTSRQGLLRLAAGAGLAAVLGDAAASAAPEAAARRCRPNGRPCVINDNDCCSGFCKRTGSGTAGQCRNSPAAQGCQVRDNSCAPRSGSDGTRCPGNRNGRCFIQPNGIPLCSTAGGCFNCDSAEDCNRRFDRQGGICINCGNCENTGRRACIFD